MLANPDITTSSEPFSKSFLSLASPLMILVAVFAFRLFFTTWVNLIPDECSYWTWSRRLDWSYFDNSGMVAYLIRFSTEGFGRHTPFTVRFPFLLLSVLSMYLFYRVSFVLFRSRSRALLASAVFNLTPAVLLGEAAAIHDNALIFFWMVALWAAGRFLKSGNNDWFYVMGFAAGFSIQSKYTGVLILPCIFMFLLCSRPHRKRLITKEPWIGALIALLFSLPIILWNMEHGWASLHHIFYIGSGSVTFSRSILDGMGYHLAQVALVSPLIYFALLVAVGTSFYKNFISPKPEEILLLCFGLPLIIFGLLSFKGHVEANWAFMGYASTLILTVEIISRGQNEGNHGIWLWFGRRFQKWAAILAVGTAIVVILHGWVGIIPAGLEKKIGKSDRIVWETRGWDGLGQHVGGLKTAGDVVAADSYQLCAILEFNVPGNPRVRYLAPWNRPTQFDVWEPSFDNLKGKNILYVSPRRLEPSSASFTTIFENFDRVETLPAYKVLYHGVAIREIYLYRGYDFNPFFPRKLGPRSLLYSG